MSASRTTNKQQNSDRADDLIRLEKKLRSVESKKEEIDSKGVDFHTILSVLTCNSRFGY